MQSNLDEPWFQQDDPETVEMIVGIEGVGIKQHEVPLSFLEQEFPDNEARRKFVHDQIDSMGLSVSILWRDDVLGSKDDD